MNTDDMMAMFLAQFDVSNVEASNNKQDRPWRVMEIRSNQFVVRHNDSNKKFRVVISEEA